MMNSGRRPRRGAVDGCDVIRRSCSSVQGDACVGPVVMATLCDSADPPTIKKTQSSETKLGQMGALQCDATAVPAPEFEWYRDEKR